MPARSGQLILGEDGGGPRHFLDGEPVHTGTVLELLLEEEHWLTVRFETAATHKPVFCLRVEGTEEEATLRLPAGAILRWPNL